MKYRIFKWQTSQSAKSRLQAFTGSVKTADRRCRRVSGRSSFIAELKLQEQHRCAIMHLQVIFVQDNGKTT